MAVSEKMALLEEMTLPEIPADWFPLDQEEGLCDRDWCQVRKRYCFVSGHIFSLDGTRLELVDRELHIAVMDRNHPYDQPRDQPQWDEMETLCGERGVTMFGKPEKTPSLPRRTYSCSECQRRVGKLLRQRRS